MAQKMLDASQKLSERLQASETVTGHFGPMRKPDTFYVISSPSGKIVIAGERWTGIFDKHGVGKLTSGKKKIAMTFPPQFVMDCMNTCQSLGDLVLFDSQLTIATPVPNSIENL